MADARWALIREVIDGKTKVRARVVNKGPQDPGLHQGLVETAGCVSLRSSDLHLVPVCSMNKWEIWNPAIKNPCLQADTFRDVFVHAPPKWDPS